MENNVLLWFIIAEWMVVFSFVCIWHFLGFHCFYITKIAEDNLGGETTSFPCGKVCFLLGLSPLFRFQCQCHLCSFELESLPLSICELGKKKMGVSTNEIAPMPLCKFSFISEVLTPPPSLGWYIYLHLAVCSGFFFLRNKPLKDKDLTFLAFVFGPTTSTGTCAHLVALCWVKSAGWLKNESESSLQLAFMVYCEK